MRCAPTVRAVSKAYAGKVKLVVVDMYTPSGEQRAQELKVRGHPVLLVQDRTGREALRIVGLVSTERIQQAFALLATEP